MGLKPSRGRTSYGPDPGVAVGGLGVEGVLSRTVRDTAAMLDVAQGYMPGDPYTAPPPARSYRNEVGAPTGRLRVGVMTTSPMGITPVHAECVKAAEQTARLLRELGHDVEPSHPAALDDFEVGRHFSVMYAVQIVGTLAALERLSGKTLGPEDVDTFNWELASLGRNISVAQYLETQDWIDGVTRRMASWWADGFDLLVTPTLPEPPPPIGYFAPDPTEPTITGLRASGFACWTSPFNMTGQPGISLPLHWTPDGLPVGVQLVAAYGREDLLVRIAAALEQAAPWIDRRPPLFG